VARPSTAVERCAVLGRLEGLPVLVPRPEQRDYHHQWRPGANQGIESTSSGRERGIDVELELYAPRSKLTQDYCGSAGVTSCPSPATPSRFRSLRAGRPYRRGRSLSWGEPARGAEVQGQLDRALRLPTGELERKRPGAFVYQTKTAPLLRRMRTLPRR